GAVITKLARGHAFYELHEHCLDEPAIIQCLPLDRMMPHEKQTFENPPAPTLCPEIGSRAMHRMLIVDNGSQIFHDWITIQNGMYRYHASLSNNIHIRIVIQDYLACDVIWE
ncbi:MAG: hypothetical protein FWC10_07595, partial [Lentimicrobiaceae bacterium]|nr:hypothetical protein [Lentimicrobiaceae bacterium]